MNYEKTDEVTIDIIQGIEGKCVVINDTRVAGEKPWGGGRIIGSYKTTVEKILNSLGVPENIIYELNNDS